MKTLKKFDTGTSRKSENMGLVFRVFSFVNSVSLSPQTISNARGYQRFYIYLAKQVNFDMVCQICVFDS